MLVKWGLNIHQTGFGGPSEHSVRAWRGQHQELQANPCRLKPSPCSSTEAGRATDGVSLSLFESDLGLPFNTTWKKEGEPS